MFDLANRFALLDPSAGAGALECVRVGAEGRTRACPRCAWRVFAHESECENCGLANESSAETEIIALPMPRVVIESGRWCTRREELAVRLADLRASVASHFPIRMVLRAGPKRFRREVRARIANDDRDVDVVCSTRAVSKWRDAGANVRIHTPRSLAAHPLEPGSLLVIDTRASLRATTATHRALRTAAHPSVIARAPERRISDPDAMFALTDLVAPATFATLNEARSLHHHARTDFLRRRDAVVLDEIPTPVATRIDRGFLAVVTHGHSSPHLVTAFTCNGTWVVLPGARPFLTALASDAIDRTPVAFDPDVIDAIAAAHRAYAPGQLARTLTRLANAYALRVDAAPSSRRAAIAKEFATRSKTLLSHAALNICIAPLASFTMATHAAR